MSNSSSMDEDYQSNYSFALIFCNIEQNDIKVSNVKLIEKSVIIKFFYYY